MSKYLKYLPQPLLDDIINNRCVPIIGAGFSRNADVPVGQEMPLWQDLGEYFAKQMNYPFINPLDAISAYAHEFSRSKLIEELRGLLHIDTATPGLTHLAFAKLQFDTVITTNFDFLLEKSYESNKKPYYPLIFENQLSTMPLNKYSRDLQNTTCILKMHGDLNHPDNLIVTEEDYDTFLTKFPLLNTHIANLLISQTPLLIGYSLEDPDLRSIWQLISSRLGNLRRNAYTIALGTQKHQITRFERRGIKVITLPGKPTNYRQILTKLFEEIHDYWSDKLAEVSTVTNEDSLMEFILPRDTKTRLCFFYVPYRLLSFYKSYIFPIFIKYGFTPITTDDIISPGDNFIAKISSLIDRASLMVIDISLSMDRNEISRLLNKSNQVIIIREEHSDFIFDPNIKVFERPKDWEIFDIDDFLLSLENYVKDISEQLFGGLKDEPRRLLEKKEGKAAVISVISLLEIELRELFEKKLKDHLDLNRNNRFKRKRSINMLLELAVRANCISEDKFSVVQEAIAIRHKLVHEKENISLNRARKIVDDVMGIIDEIRDCLTNSN